MTRQIVLAGRSMTPFGVRHEMLHAVLPVGGHPRDQFLGRCQDIVSCGGPCADESGGHPDPAETAPEIGAQELETRFDVVPAELSASIDSGAMAVVIHITNPYPYDVWVRLIPEPASASAATYGVLFDPGDPALQGGRVMGTRNLRFGMLARETRRWVWEQTVREGPLGVQAFFNADTAPRIQVNVHK